MSDHYETHYRQLEVQRLEDELDRLRRLVGFQNGVIITAQALIEALHVEDTILSETAIPRYCALRDALNAFYRA
jgi:hypothetical protein